MKSRMQNRVQRVQIVVWSESEVKIRFRRDDWRKERQYIRCADNDNLLRLQRVLDNEYCKANGGSVNAQIAGFPIMITFHKES